MILWPSLIHQNPLTIWENKLCVFTEVNSRLSKVLYLNDKIRIKSGNKFLGLRMEKLFCIKLTDIKQQRNMSDNINFKNMCSRHH